MTTPLPLTPTYDAVSANPQPAVPPFEMSWDRTTTPLEALERSIYALAEQLTASVSDAGSAWSVTVHPRGPQADPESLAHRLRQEVNDQTLRVRIGERTDPIRNLVFALAFSRSDLAAGNPATGSEAGAS